MTRSQRLVLFASLYLGQGAVLSYFFTFNILYLTAQGFPADEIGYFQAILVLPFVLKILLGMLSDRFSLFGLGHRSPYILLGLLIQVSCFALLPLVDLPAGLDLFFLLCLLAAFGMALSDTGTDGLAVEATPEHERALVQGVMVGARAGGILLSLLLGGWLANQLGWPAMFGMIVVLGLPGILLTLWLWQKKSGPAASGFSWMAFRGLARSDVLSLAAMGMIYALALDGVLSFLSFHRDAALLGDIGAVSSLVAVAMFGRILGAAVSGRLTDRLGYRSSLRVAITLSALACLGMSVTLGPIVLAIVCLVFGFAYGYCTTTYSALAMTLTDPRIAASMFAIFMMFINLGIGLGQGLGGTLTQQIGFQGLAWTMATISLLNLLFLRRVPSR